MMNSLRLSALGAFTLLVSLASVAAQTAPALRSYNSYYFFGDSLTDSGNLYAATGGANPPAVVPGTGTGYFNGRFSNGATYAEYLRPGLANHITAAAAVKTNLNFAFAGAQASGAAALPPALGLQVGLFQSRAITPTGNDVFVLLAGANDLLNAIQVPANQNATAMTATGVAASTAVATAAQNLAGLGAKNIFVLNLPDISRTPRFTTGSGAAGALFMQNGVLAFNNDIRTRLAALNLPAGTNLTLFDLSAVFNTLISNPALFGFSVTNQEYLGVLAAGGTPGPVGNYVFFDGIHPTTKAHQILAGALVEALNPEFVLGTAAVQSTVVLASTDLATDLVDDRLSLIRQGARRERADGWVNYSYKDAARDWNGYQAEFDYQASVISAGFDAQVFDSVLAGLAFSAETADVDLAGGAGTFRLGGQMVHAYAHWDAGAWFVQASAGLGSHDLSSIVRTTALGGLPTSGKTKGNRWTGALKVGGEFGNESLRFTPFAGVRYARARLDAYSETGVGGLNFSFDGQTAISLDGLVGATADWSVPAGDHPLVVSLSALYQTDLGDDTRAVSGRLADTVAATNTLAAEDGLGESFKLGVRVAGKIGGKWGWSAGYQAEIRDDGDTASQYSLSVHTGF